MLASGDVFCHMNPPALNAHVCGAGTTDTYYRSSNGKRFRSIKAALEHMGKPVVQVKSSKKDAPSKAAPEKHVDQKKSPSPIRHHTSKLIIKGSMLRAAAGPGQAKPADTANAQASAHQAAQGDKQAEDGPETGDLKGYAAEPAEQSQSTAGPTNPGKNFASMSALAAPAGSSPAGIKQTAAPGSSQGKANPKAPAPGQPVPSPEINAAALNLAGLFQGSRGKNDSMGVKQEPTGQSTQGKKGDHGQGSASAEHAEATADATAAKQCTGDRAADEKHAPSLAVKTLLGSGRRKRKSAFPSPCQPLWILQCLGLLSAVKRAWCAFERCTLAWACL